MVLKNQFMHLFHQSVSLKLLGYQITFQINLIIIIFLHHYMEEIFLELNLMKI